MSIEKYDFLFSNGIDKGVTKFSYDLRPNVRGSDSNAISPWVIKSGTLSGSFTLDFQIYPSTIWWLKSLSIALKHLKLQIMVRTPQCLTDSR